MAVAIIAAWGWTGGVSGNLSPESLPFFLHDPKFCPVGGSSCPSFSVATSEVGFVECAPLGAGCLVFKRDFCAADLGVVGQVTTQQMFPLDIF